jgi:putative membrane protein
MMDAEHFFSAEENRRIEAAIKAAEAETAGEIVVTVTDESDTYPEAIVLGGVILGGLAALVITDIFFHGSLRLYIPCAGVLAILAGFLLKFLPTLRRLFVSTGHIDRRVKARAMHAFYAKGLYKTRDQSGVLFFLSLFERKVWVIADQGIYAKISQEELQTYTRQIVSGIKDGRKTDALCAEITRMGKLLAQHFPIKPDDTNELPNEVIVEGKDEL